MICRPLLLLALTFLMVPLLSGGIIGTNPPALPLTIERIAELSGERQVYWRAYLIRSERQLRTDRASFLAEMKRNGLNQSVVPPQGRSGSRLPLRESAAWYGS